MGKPIDVQLASHPARSTEAFAAYRGLAERFAAENVYLLESIDGPAVDVQRSVIGVGPLIALTISQQQVTLDGLPSLCSQVRERALALDCVEVSGSGLALRGPDALWRFLRAVQSCFVVHGNGIPRGFQFGFFGYFGYDAAWFVETLPQLIGRPLGDAPDIALSIYRTTIHFDLEDGTVCIVDSRSREWDSQYTTVAKALDGCECPSVPRPVPEAPEPIGMSDTCSPEAYRAGVQRALAHIQAGDVYQIQLGHSIHVETEVLPLTVYERMRWRNPAPYMYLANIGGSTLIGASPELFIRVEDNRLTMRPIAGTAQPGETPEQDKIYAEQLGQDPKEQAEHVMLVDLCRNDMGRVCHPDTLEVTELMQCERFARLTHLVSTVTAEIDSADTWDILASAFPAGTMTGAPKIRAMELIESIETTPRGIYAGCIGLFGFSGHVNSALCIRSVVHRSGTYRVRASAGVVVDSTPEREWRETLAKLSAPVWAVSGKEVRP